MILNCCPQCSYRRSDQRDSHDKRCSIHCYNVAAVNTAMSSTTADRTTHPQVATTGPCIFPFHLFSRFHFCTGLDQWNAATCIGSYCNSEIQFVSPFFLSYFHVYLFCVSYQNVYSLFDTNKASSYVLIFKLLLTI